jgi:hypothetical protein
MIPPFAEDSPNLPPGIHECTLDEVEQRFSYGECRNTLFAKLREIHEIVLRCGFTRLIVWGSFPTAKNEPHDIDLFVTMQPDLDRAAIHRDCNDLLDHLRATERWGFTVLSCADNGIHRDALIEGLGYDRRVNRQGLLSIQLL